MHCILLAILQGVGTGGGGTYTPRKNDRELEVRRVARRYDVVCFGVYLLIYY